MHTKEPLIVYSAAWCHDCQALKAYLTTAGITYENRDIKENPAWGRELEEQTGKLGVPYFRVGDEWIIGYEPGVGFTEAYAQRVLAGFLVPADM